MNATSRSRLLRAVVLALALAAAGSCATLPDTEALRARHSGQQARFETASGPLSAARSAAILAALKLKSGDIDILDKHVALEQSVTGSPLLTGNSVLLLQDGAATYPAMFEAIRGARDHVNLQTYMFEDDETGRQFAELLMAQQARGVQVNLIYDSVGALATPRAFFQRLQGVGIAVLEFNPVNPLVARAAWQINNRDHRKLLIVDGHTAFLGGINISSVYSAGSISLRRGKSAGDGTQWRDSHVRLQGPVVAELQKLFIGSWEKQRGKPLATRSYFPTPKSTGSELVRAIGSTPDDDYSAMYLTLISAIENAERQVYLTNAYFVPDPQLLKSLKAAAARGVDVRLVLPGKSDSALVFHAGRSHYATLLESGVKLYERGGAVMHAKTAVIDGVWSTVGSTNLDWRSFLYNDELDAVVLGREFGQQMQAAFAADMAASQAVDGRTWARRAWLLRLKEAGARVWERLL